MSEENKKTATERLEDLEKTMMNVIQALQPLDPLSRDMMGLKEALKLLNNKLEAVVRAINEGGSIDDDRLSKFMVDNNVKELKDKVDQMVTQGILVPSDTVNKESFVVVNEVDPNGTVVNPRMQFLLSALQHEELRTKLESSKVGTNLTVGDKGASINVLETYDVSTPKAPEATDTATSTDVPQQAETTTDSPAKSTAETPDTTTATA